MDTVILCSHLLPEEIRVVIESKSGMKCVSIPACNTLPTPVNHHPDMLFFNPPNKEITVLSSGYNAVNPHFFENFATANIELDTVPLQPQYPFDIAFDALSVGDTLYCLEAHTAESVKKHFSKIVNVRQGYAACSTLVLNEKTAITADGSISKALKQNGVTVLDIAPKGIALPGYDSGFIGGASAVVGDTVIFFGNLSDHPNRSEIITFCKENGFETLDFPPLPLTDYGSVRKIFQ